MISTDPAKRKQFKQFVNTSERRPQAEIITERGQQRPADWAKAYPEVKLSPDQFTTPKAEWKWIKVATKDDMMPTEAGTTSVAVKYGDTQLAIYHVPKRGYYSTQQMQVYTPFYSKHGLTF
jgi:nitrite reductase (NAD(P)H)